MNPKDQHETSMSDIELIERGVERFGSQAALAARAHISKRRVSLVANGHGHFARSTQETMKALLRGEEVPPIERRGAPQGSGASGLAHLWLLPKEHRALEQLAYRRSLSLGKVLTEAIRDYLKTSPSVPLPSSIPVPHGCKPHRVRCAPEALEELSNRAGNERREHLRAAVVRVLGDEKG